MKKIFLICTCIYLATVVKAQRDCRQGYFNFSWDTIPNILNSSPELDEVFQSWLIDSDTILISAKKIHYSSPFFVKIYDNPSFSAYCLSFQLRSGDGNMQLFNGYYDNAYLTKNHTLYLAHKFSKSYESSSAIIFINRDTFDLKLFQYELKFMGYDELSAYFLWMPQHNKCYQLIYSFKELKLDTLPMATSRGLFFLNKDFEIRPKLISTHVDECGLTMWFSLQNLKGKEFDLPVFSEYIRNTDGYLSIFPYFSSQLYSFKYEKDNLFFLNEKKQLFMMSWEELKMIFDVNWYPELSKSKLLSYQIKGKHILIQLEQKIKAGESFEGKTFNGIDISPNATVITFYVIVDSITNSISYPQIVWQPQ